MMATTYRRTYADDSDDEIVWNLRDRREPLTSSPTYSSVSDFSSEFVIISRPLSPALHTIPSGSRSRTAAGPQLHTPITATFNVSLTQQVAKLRISGGAKGSAQKVAKKAKPPVVQTGVNQPASTKKQEMKSKKKKAKRGIGATAAPGDAYPSPSPSPRAKKIAAPAPAKAKKDQRGGGPKTTKPTVPQSNTDVRPVVSTTSQAAAVPSLYEEASAFISRFLGNPKAKNDKVCRLTLLQSLIIELGLATSNLPVSLTAARAFLKARAFLNIREYIALRGQGPDAIRKAMYPSKSALIKNIRKHKGKRAPLQWVKDMGLQVLLVGCMH